MSCETCGKKAGLKCSGCDTPYCGLSCQHQDTALCERSMSRKQSGKVSKVMREFEAGHLHSGSKNGPIVTSRKQALAIAYAEAMGE